MRRRGRRTGRRRRGRFQFAVNPVHANAAARNSLYADNARRVALPLRGAHEAHRPRERPLVDEGDPRKAECRSALDERLGGRRRTQKAEGRARMQFGEARRSGKRHTSARRTSA